MAATIRIAVDIGGTFTDLQILDEATGQTHALKTPTTPDDPSIGLLTGIREAAQRFGFGLNQVGFLMHGTTIATNAVLERKLPAGVLITTAGFEDVLEIGRHVRRDIYGLKPPVQPPLIARDRRFGIPERITGQGTIEKPLDEAALEGLLARIDAASTECVAICLLNAFVNPTHEQRLKAWLAEARPHLPVSLSSEISPEIREYERTSTTVLNALLMPVVKSYLDRLERRLEAEGFRPRVFLVQSNGGVCGLRTAAEQPARLLLSGPSGGALAAMRTSEAMGEPNLVAVDMGGTSFDVSVVKDGRITLVTQGEVGQLPVRLPMVEIRTIGAGGGSIASVDAGGRLTVGPRSAGAKPGPVCYRRGGVEPTVTDANLVLGRLDPAAFLGGEMALDADGARRAMEERVGSPLGLSVEQAAAGMLKVTNASLAAAIRLSLFEKGLDPRDFALLSFGGAGGLHATEVAEELGMTRVVFPRDPSTLSAFGILYSDIVQDIARSKVLRAERENATELARMTEELRAQATALLDAEGIPAGDRQLALAADMRYLGQAFEILVPWGEVTPDAASLTRLLDDFHALHRQRFSYANPGAPVEIVTLRMTATGRLRKPSASPQFRGDRPALKGRRRAYRDEGWADLPVHDRDSLSPGVALPAGGIVEEAYTTIYLGRDWGVAVDSGGNLVATTQRADMAEEAAA